LFCPKSPAFREVMDEYSEKAFVVPYSLWRAGNKQLQQEDYNWYVNRKSDV